MATNRNVNSNTIYNVIKSVSAIIYPLITFPYISRVLLPENVGKLNYGNSIIGYFSLVATLGVTTYAIRECAKVRDDKVLLGETASQILSINLLSTAIAYIGLFVTLLIASPLKPYRALICLQSTSILFTTLGADWINTALEDFKYITIRTVGVQIVSLILMFLFVKKPSDYIVYALISVAASSGAQIINFFYRRKFCHTKITTHLNLRKHLKPILLLFSMILTQTIYCNSDMTMLGLMRGDYEVGLYSTSVKLYTIVNTLVASVGFVVMPALSSAFSKKDYTEINSYLTYALNFIVLLGLPCIVGICSIPSEIIYLIAGQEYLGATLSLQILTIALACSFIGGWIGNLTMLTAGREDICLKSAVWSSAANVILNLFLIPRFGLNAAAATTAFAEFIGIVYKYPFMDKNIQLPKLIPIFRAPLVGSVGIILISLACKATFSSPILTAVTTIVFSIVFYLIILVLLRDSFFENMAEPVLRKIKRR